MNLGVIGQSHTCVNFPLDELNSILFNSVNNIIPYYIDINI